MIPSKQMECIHCAKPANGRCENCHITYCSKKCQIAHWPQHIETCQRYVNKNAPMLKKCIDAKRKTTKLTGELEILLRRLNEEGARPWEEDVKQSLGQLNKLNDKDYEEKSDITDKLLNEITDNVLLPGREFLAIVAKLKSLKTERAQRLLKTIDDIKTGRIRMSLAERYWAMEDIKKVIY